MKKTLILIMMTFCGFTFEAQNINLTDVYNYANKVNMPNSDRELLIPMVIGSFEGNPEIVYNNASKLSNKGYSIGDYFLGWCYEGGENVPFDLKKAQEYFHKATTNKNPFNWAYRGLGFSYYNGDSGAKDYREALKWFSKAADEIQFGAYKGQSFLAMGIIYQGEGNVPANEDLEYQYIKKSAELGWPYGEEKLAQLLFTSKKYGNEKEARYWIAKAANNGMTNSQFIYGYLLLQDGNKTEGIKYLRKAATQGVIPAMQLLEEYQDIHN